MCDPFTIVSPDKSDCIQPTCESNEVIEFNGECKKCGPYRIASMEKFLLECDFPVCLEREVIEFEGTCRLCDIYEIASS